MVPGLQGVHPEWEEVPGAQTLRQPLWPACLQHVYHNNRDEQHHDGHKHSDQDLPAGQGQAEDQQWDDKEAADDVETCKPTVLRCLVPQSLSQPDWHTSEGYRVPQHYT